MYYIFIFIALVVLSLSALSHSYKKTLKPRVRSAVSKLSSSVQISNEKLQTKACRSGARNRRAHVFGCRCCCCQGLCKQILAGKSRVSFGTALRMVPDAIVSPFDSSAGQPVAGATITEYDDELPLTRENVELVLDEMRPYLKADGGNVRLAEIDGPVVKLELEGACGSCPSSSMTMKMGLERKLKERIPEIAEVIQTMPNTPDLTEANIETVLDGVRPFLSVAGGKISIVSVTDAGGLQPVIALKMEGTALALQSVKLEIMQRIQRHFVRNLRVDWV